MNTVIESLPVDGNEDIGCVDKQRIVEPLEILFESDVRGVELAKIRGNLDEMRKSVFELNGVKDGERNTHKENGELILAIENARTIVSEVWNEKN